MSPCGQNALTKVYTEDDMVDFTFKENTKVADINGVPEKYRGLYAAGEGDDAVEV